MQPFELEKYKEIAFRRKWWIIIPFLVTLLGGLAYALQAPKIYEAETLILVQPQKVPQDYVRSIVSIETEDRLRTITQQVTSRTNLEKIIDEHNLFADESRGHLFLEQKVEALRRHITIDVAEGRRGSTTSAFTIRFQGKDPRKTMQVTNSLASNFITENLRIRESQALGTSAFLSDELESVKRRLLEKEEELKQYREKYMGGLPEQLDTNLSILERLQGQLEQLNSNLRDAENRRIIVQKEISAAEKHLSSSRDAAIRQGSPPQDDLAALRSRLEDLEAKYTEKHPDVISLRQKIAQLEAKQASAPSSPEPAEQKSPPAGIDPTLIRNLDNIELEIASLKTEIKKLKSQIAWYQTKVEETPKREQELLSLNRDYENLKELYNSLLNRQLEAEIALSMEKKQKGEQFRIIDPAKVPSLPVKPDVQKIILLTFVLGLGLGGGLTYWKEMMDTSYKIPEDLEKDLNLPVLVTMPIRYTQWELKSMKIKNILALVSVAAAFILSAAGIVIAFKGVDKTLEFIQETLTRI